METPDSQVNSCINCGSSISAKYCSNCGQRSGVKRITFKESWFDFWSRIYGLDGMFPRTIRDLTIRPGIVTRKILDGNRVMYYGPVGYFFLMVTLFIVVAGILNVDISEFLNQKQNTIGNFTVTGEREAELNKIVTDFISNNLRLIAFLVIPFNALAARFILFRKSGFNYMEHAVMPLYMIGHFYWLNIISIIIYFFSGSFFLNTVNSGILFLYFGYGYLTLFSGHSKVKSFIKGVLVYILGQFAMILAMVIIAVITVLIILNYNPDFFSSFGPATNK